MVFVFVLLILGLVVGIWLRCLETKNFLFVRMFEPYREFMVREYWIKTSLDAWVMYPLTKHIDMGKQHFIFTNKLPNLLIRRVNKDVEKVSTRYKMDGCGWISLVGTDRAFTLAFQFPYVTPFQMFEAFKEHYQKPEFEKLMQGMDYVVIYSLSSNLYYTSTIKELLPLVENREE